MRSESVAKLWNRLPKYFKVVYYLAMVNFVVLWLTLFSVALWAPLSPDKVNRFPLRMKTGHVHFVPWIVGYYIVFGLIAQLILIVFVIVYPALFQRHNR